MKQLDKTNQFIIDVATTDVVRLENQYHFSCSYERDPHYPTPTGLANVDVLRFPIDESLDTDRLQNSRRLWEVWSSELRDMSLRHIDRLPDTILLGGWYFPEKSALETSIWSSPIALIRTRNVDSISLNGYSPVPNELQIFSKNEILFSTSVDGYFHFNFKTQGADLIQLRAKLSYTGPEDARSLGVWVNKILCESPTGWRLLPLDLNFRDVLRSLVPAEFIQTLIDGAEAPADHRRPLSKDSGAEFHSPRDLARTERRQL